MLTLLEAYFDYDCFYYLGCAALWYNTSRYKWSGGTYFMVQRWTGAEHRIDSTQSTTDFSTSSSYHHNY